MADVDYGYGERYDYGYGDSEPEMIAEDVKPKDTYYSAPDDGYGYDGISENVPEQCTNNELDQPSTHIRRPKRRCSVTKFTLESGDAATSLTAASVIANMRNGIVPESDGITTSDAATMITPNPSTDFDNLDENDIDNNNMDTIQDMVSDDSPKKNRNGMLRLLSLRR
jgi:hypothetical protein